MLNPHIFRAYDVRGRVGLDINPALFEQVDRAYATLIGLVRLARPLTVVVDAGNGVAALYAPELLRRIGCEVIELYCESDGRFPNHLPDPEDPANVVDLQREVVAHGADLGVAYDGD